MNVNELIKKTGLKVFNLGDGERTVEGGYCGDLLSWVMGRAPENSAWITIMSNRNLVAVASMTDVACIILSEGVIPDDDMLEKAVIEEINVLGTDLSTYKMAVALAWLI